MWDSTRALFSDDRIDVERRPDSPSRDEDDPVNPANHLFLDNDGRLLAVPVNHPLRAWHLDLQWPTLASVISAARTGYFRDHASEKGHAARCPVSCVVDKGRDAAGESDRNGTKGREHPPRHRKLPRRDIGRADAIPVGGQAIDLTSVGSRPKRPAGISYDPLRGRDRPADFRHVTRVDRNEFVDLRLQLLSFIALTFNSRVTSSVLPFCGVAVAEKVAVHRGGERVKLVELCR
jgi:hypothetical protein